MPNATNAAEIAERMFRIVLLVTSRRAGTLLRTEDLARDCGCSSRTIKRTLDLMRGRPGFPIEYDASERAFVFTDRAWRLPLVPLEKADALSLALARELLGAQGIPHRAAMIAALDKVTAGLPSPLKTLAHEAAQAIAPTVLPRSYAHAPLTLLLEACSARHSVEIDYESRLSKTRVWRRVDPYALEPRAGVYWELHGWCHKNQAIRTFALDRIHDARDTGEGFAWRTEAWEQFCREPGAGGLRGGSPVDVDAVFALDAAPYALARTWPGGLTIAAQTDGTARLSGSVRGTDGFIVELLSWRRHVQVIGGPELREQMADEIRAMHALYTDSDTDWKFK